VGKQPKLYMVTRVCESEVGCIITQPSTVNS